MYTVELLCPSKRALEAVDQSISLFNKVQSGIRFVTSPESLQRRSIRFDGPEINSIDLFSWLQDELKTSSSCRRNVLCVIEGKLRTPNYDNAFSSHRVEFGLGICTLYQQNAFNEDVRRYLQFQMLRFAIRLLVPSLKSHEDKQCLFDRREQKLRIRTSLDTCRLCPDCDSEVNVSIGQCPELVEAIRILRDTVATGPNYTLVLQGGGVKGVAYTGAVEVLMKYVRFDCFVGTSAGAITAALLAAGFSGEELVKEMIELEFGNFRDPLWKIPGNVLSKGALHSGRKLGEWLDEKLKTKINSPDIVLLRDLRNRVVMYASDSLGTVIFDSQGERRETPVAFAVTCSSAIPFFFAAPKISNRNVVDGGLHNNFPLERFGLDNPGSEIIGVGLRSNTQAKDSFVSIVVNDSEGRLFRLLNYVFQIPVGDIKTTDFNLDKKKKSFLISSGRLAAIEFLRKFQPDNCPTLDEQEVAKIQLNASIDNIRA